MTADPRRCPLLLAQLSDPHIDPARPGKAAALSRAVAHLLTLRPLPDAVIVTGDLTDHGAAEEYAEFRRLVAPLLCPVYVIPGNHDDRGAMLEIFGNQGGSGLPGFVQYAVEDLPVRLLALDTLVPGQGGGELDRTRLDWLEARLAEAPGRPTLLLLHHPPFATGLKVMDEIGLDGAGALADLVSRFPHVAGLVCGHLHMPLTRAWAGTTVHVCPATDASWLPDRTQPGKLIIQRQPPMILLHVWSEATGLLTHTSAIGSQDDVTLHDGERWVG